jgi:hypothetical protein
MLNNKKNKTGSEEISGILTYTHTHRWMANRLTDSTVVLRASLSFFKESRLITFIRTLLQHKDDRNIK